MSEMKRVRLEETIADANGVLRKQAGLSCFTAWRSIGSNVFFEFGTPVSKRVTPKTRPAFTVERGEVAIGIHADSWRVFDAERVVLDSVDVTDAKLAQATDIYFRGAALPTLSLNSAEKLTLTFGLVVVVVQESERARELNHDLSFEELTITTPGLALSFNYERGFFAVR